MVCCGGIFACVATLYVGVKVVLWIAQAIWWLALRPTANWKQYGKWALVTGCTNGIGEALARALAKRGFNLFLIGRNQAALNTLAQELATAHNISYEIAVIDCAAPDAIEKCKAAGAAFAIRTAADGSRGVVVNCAGLSYDHPDYFTATDFSHHMNIVNVNVGVLVALTHATIPAITNGGIVINVASVGGAQEEPLLATYAASKAFVINLSAALDKECAESGRKVRVQALCPAMVVSNMSKVRKASLGTPTAKVYADAVMSCAGVGPSLCVAYWPHYLQYLALTSIPHFVAQKFLWNMHADLRSRALRRKQK